MSLRAGAMWTMTMSNLSDSAPSPGTRSFQSATTNSALRIPAASQFKTARSTIASETSTPTILLTSLASPRDHIPVPHPMSRTLAPDTSPQNLRTPLM
ncbi:MAG: hypothetical protein IKQ60_05385 [Candidatus Methanomethylophilaceae archaeon]|nr:hypothetical protein [Candidatus Methanomethylophilaceae archaeon]